MERCEEKFKCFIMNLFKEKSVKVDEDKKKSNNLIDLVKRYEERNAWLEKRHDSLAKRVRLMEMALPSILLGNIVDNHQQQHPT